MTRGDEEGDAAMGKARYHVPAWAVLLALHRRSMAAVATVCCAVAVAFAARLQAV